MKAVNNWLSIVEVNDDESYGIKTVSEEDAILIAKRLVKHFQVFEGEYDVYITELTKERVLEMKRQDEEELEIEYDDIYDMLDYYCENLGVAYYELKNGNILYLTTEL